jgi:hypothetical protein
MLKLQIVLALHFQSVDSNQFSLYSCAYPF